jgi:hypothetical protein
MRLTVISLYLLPEDKLPGLFGWISVNPDYTRPVSRSAHGKKEPSIDWIFTLRLCAVYEAYPGAWLRSSRIETMFQPSHGSRKTTQHSQQILSGEGREVIFLIP